MPRTVSSPNLADYRTVGEAAEFLGVSRATLRNWDRAGKLRPRRHPQNGYRIYLHDELETLLRSTDVAEPCMNGAHAPPVDWSALGESEHFVQFYENDEFLVESVSGFVSAGLGEGQGIIVIATLEHRAGLESRLAASGVDLAETVAEGRYAALDAAETLSGFMVDGLPDRRRFVETVGAVTAKLARRGNRVRAFGEMVALLWADGNRDAAIRLEELWNELGKKHRFALYCAYPIDGFDGQDDAASFDGVCNCHASIIPGESYSAIDSADNRLRAIAALQQKAQSLEAEVAHRKQVENALSHRERDLVDFFENGTEGLHRVGPDGHILWVNKAECDLLGYSAEEVVGRSIADFHADSEVIAEILQKLQTGETLDNYPARLRCKNGRIRHVLINSNACFENGQFAYTRCFTRDVTRQWQAESALREANHRKDEFLATLAHELRNPLAPLRNAVELLKIDDRPEVVEEVRDVMERQVQQMSRLVDDLLDVSRITRDKIELRKQRVDMEAVLRSAIETSRPLIDSAGHRLLLELPGEPLFLHADPTRMAQVFSNLLNNSAKYTQSGGRIEVKVERAGDEVVVVVRDNGIGISCDTLAHVFDMFHQLGPSLERAQGGLGIGLTLVRRLVELHGGSVNAESDGPGQGSAFTVRLPLAGPAAGDAAVPSAARVASMPKRRILVVDDNRDSGDTLSRLLRTKGHDVRLARDGLEAVAMAREFLPQVILMDVGMPNLNGYDATRRIRQLANGSEPFIVALTGWGQAADVQKSADAGCSAHLIKPVDFAALERLLTGWEASNR